ncbi:MAG: hypothetical protein A3H57_02045 [Candidatus Taylorbacteria bacterium RIFCSPLOWO2_02_FULL_43_11]|nr:MAG: hypothetical protein A2743_04235 [Candidatus Taylorbacteria bacterium RIFCSPHIGHO2_01_FULL_43_47]OHA37035.1 MAG: hypothetical protein A3H57_02045 [Candidatus Taylorbacteria bacterium RIFCSPLOWO2_02_FULL_43_11]
MFNLLPNKDREIVKGEYRRRLFVVSLFFIMGGLLSSLLLLLPSAYVAYEGNNAVRKVLAEYLQKPEISSYSSISKEVEATRSQLVAIKSAMTAEADITSLIKEVESKKPKGVEIYAFSWNFQEGSISIILSGKALTRTLLQSFETEMKKSEMFSSVDVPRSSYAKADNPQFSMSILINSQNESK